MILHRFNLVQDTKLYFSLGIAILPTSKYLNFNKNWDILYEEMLPYFNKGRFLYTIRINILFYLTVCVSLSRIIYLL